MFKKFIKRILECEGRDEAINKVFYGADGIERAFDLEKISYTEYELLAGIINKMAE